MVIKLDIEVGDIVLTGRFKNKRTKVKTIGTDEFGHPTINGKPILKLRIEKLMPKDKQSKQTREELTEAHDMQVKRVSKKVAKHVGDEIGIDWDKVNLEQFHMGINVEMEHGSQLGKKTNVTKDDLVKTGKIALAHLMELPDYYTQLKQIENEERVNESYELSYLLNFLQD